MFTALLRLALLKALQKVVERMGEKQMPEPEYAELLASYPKCVSYVRQDGSYVWCVRCGDIARYGVAPDLFALHLELSGQLSNMGRLACQ